MKRTIVSTVLAMVMLTVMSFTETPSKFSGECKFSKNPVTVTYGYNVSISNPEGGGGICWAEQVNYYWVLTYFGWVVIGETYIGVHCYYP